MYGRLPEPIDPIRPMDVVEVSRAFAEPIGAPETIAKYVSRLVVELCQALQQKGLGVRRADLLIHKVDNTMQAIRAGTAKPARDRAWLTKLFKDRIEKIEPGFGIEKLSLVALIAEPLTEVQKVSSLIEEEVVDIAPLIDVIGNRGQRVYRMAPVASDVPERSVRRVSAVAGETGSRSASSTETRSPASSELSRRPAPQAFASWLVAVSICRTACRSWSIQPIVPPIRA
jgi:protein ImuB